MDPIEKKLKTDLLPPDSNLGHLFGAVLSAVLYHTLCNSLKQCAMLPRLRMCDIFSICLLLFPP